MIATDRSLILLLGTVALLAFGTVAARGDMKKADDLFDKQQYEEARKEYDALLAKSEGETRARALFRAVESEVLLFRYGEAAQRLAAETMPSEALPQARFLLLKAEVAREYLKQYSHGTPSDREEGATDVTRRTPDEWHAEIQKIYPQLLPLRDTLLKRRLADESYFVEVKKTDVDVTPTLWDFAVQRWTAYLLEESPVSKEKPEAKRFLGTAFEGSLEPGAPAAELAGALLEDASRLPASGREIAGELARLRRLLIPSRDGTRVRAGRDAKAQAAAAIATLRGWTDTFREDRSRAEAAVEAAQLLESQRAFADAVALCRRVEKSWPKTPAAPRALALRARIEEPVLNLSSRPAVTEGRGALRLETRNLGEVFFRLFPTTEAELRKLAPRGGHEDRSYLRYLSEEAVLSVLGRRAETEWSVKRQPKAPHEPVRSVVDVKTSGTGLFIVAASSDRAFPPKRSLVRATVVNVTGLYLLGSASQPAYGESKSEVRFYALNAATGAPVSQVEVDSAYRLDWGPVQYSLAQTDAKGIALQTQTLAGAGSYFFDPVARHGREVAFWGQGQYLYRNRPEAVDVYLDLDRPIYRPGQKATVKVTVLRREGVRRRVFDGKEKVLVRVRDANYQELAKKQLPLNAMGSASFSFEIPTGRLLGTYSVEAQLAERGKTFRGNLGFSVEEYKRPEFELTIDDGKGAWKYGQPATVEGKAAYYFGGPVPEAKIAYRIYREPYIPWFCWWWRPWHLPWQRQEVTGGETKTDAQGRFSIAITPQVPDDETSLDRERGPFPTRYTVEVDARDTGGRTITAQHAFAAGSAAYVVQLTPATGFFRGGREAQVNVDIKNLNDQPVAADARYVLYRLDGKPGDAPDEGGEGGERADEEEEHSRTPSLDELFAKVPNGGKITSGSITTASGKGAKAELGKLAAGIYRLVTTAKDPWGSAAESSRVLVVADAAAPAALPLRSVTLTEHSSYVVGETLRALVGSTEVKQVLFVEVWHGPQLVETRQLGGGIQLVDVPVPMAARGGLSVRWFGAGEHRLYRGEVTVTVPWKDRELAVSWKVPEAVKPGEAIRWEMQVKDAEGHAVDGEATVRVFDRSLEYFARAERSWVGELYPVSASPHALAESRITLHGTQLRVEQSWLETLLEMKDRFQGADRQLPLPALRLQRGRTGGYGRFSHYGAPGRSRRSGYADAEGEMVAMDLSAAAPAAAPMAKKSEAKADSAFGGGAPADKAPPPPPAPAPRTNFAETAYFEPQLKIRGGRGIASFTMPEQLTSWKADAAVLTSDVKRGTVDAKLATRKDLMVRVEIPRFFREKDRGTIHAVVHNETDAALKGTVTLSVAAGGSTPPLKIAAPEQPFRAPAHGLTPVSWTVEIPPGTGEHAVRIIARSGKQVDAEERKLPILPSRERLITSRMIALDGNQKQAIAAPEGLEKVTVEAATLQIDPQLALPILRSLPFLVHYPCEATETVVDRFVPLAVVQAIFQKHPELARLAVKLPKRKTRVEPWDRNDPRRLTQLLETPWEMEAQGGAQGNDLGGQLVDMLDRAVVDAEKSRALELLQKYQLTDGSFPWFPGGRSDAYVTLFVAAGLADLRTFGVAYPDEMARRALVYAVREVSGRLKPTEGEVSLLLYAAYVLTAFADRPWAKDLLPAARTWLEYAAKTDRAMTAYGKAYAALAHWRLGDKEKADGYLERALDGAKADPITGVSWAPEKVSWLWYNDSVEKHAFFLRALMQMRPDDKRVPGMVQWLLFNRKGNQWKSTKASAAAIFSLLDVLKARRALVEKEQFRWSWGGEQKSIVVAATDPLRQPLRWTKSFPNGVTGPAAEALKGAQITKQGPGLAFASLTTRFVTDEPMARSDGELLRVERVFFRRVREGDGKYRLEKLASGAAVNVGDQLEAHYTVTTRSQFEYVQLRAPRGAGFEAEEATSGWRWDNIGRYEETRDTLSNFYFGWLPQGEYVLRHRWRAVTPGTYRVPSAQLQSVYAPEMAGYSSGFLVTVQKE